MPNILFEKSVNIHGKKNDWLAFVTSSTFSNDFYLVDNVENKQILLKFQNQNPDVLGLKELRVPFDYDGDARRRQALNFFSRDNTSTTKFENLKYLLFEGDVFSVGGILNFNTKQNVYEVSKPFIIVGGGI